MGAVLQAVRDVPGGAGASTPVLLVHGWTGSAEDFAPIIPSLAADRRVLVPDLPGHGGAPPPPDGDWSLRAHVEWLLELLDDRGVDQVHVVGHSHGGLVAQHLTAAAAHRVASLVLIGTGVGSVGEEMADTVRRVVRTAVEAGAEAAWQQIIDPDDATGDPRAAFVRDRFLAMPVEAIAGVGRNLLLAEPLVAFLRGIDVPVLVCHGEGDRTWRPHEQRLLARTAAGARYHVIPDALHSPAQENPDGLLDVIRPFLAAADPPPAPSTPGG